MSAFDFIMIASVECEMNINMTRGKGKTTDIIQPTFKL
jgi:hypothetical protein